MALSPEDKQRLERAYRDHMKVHNDFENTRTGTDAEYETNERRYHETEARLERIANEIGVGPEDYDELQQIVEQELDGPSISD
jgi:hypothetical protein